MPEYAEVWNPKIVADRRLKIFYFAKEVFIELLKPGEHKYFVESLVMPNDAQAINVFYSYEHDAYGIVIESKEFKKVKVGELIPRGEAIIVRAFQ